MPKVDIINYQSRKIIYTDLAKAKIADFPKGLEVIVSNSQSSVLTVMDVPDGQVQQRNCQCHE